MNELHWAFIAMPQAAAFSFTSSRRVIPPQRRKPEV